MVVRPPRLSQPDQPPANHLCQSAPSLPGTNASRRPGSHAASAGPAVAMPPRLSQGDHGAVVASAPTPSADVCQRAESLPWMATSIRPGAQDVEAGRSRVSPPRVSAKKVVAYVAV